MKTAIVIIKEWLEQNNYDGLCRPEDECECFLCDLVPCGADFSECVPGKKRMKNDGDWEIVRTEWMSL